MELRQLEAFAAVMSAGSMTAAGRLLARSQPAVTRLVQELEAEIGYPLFLRNGPRVTPTRQGFLLYEDVERALGGLQQLSLRAAEIARGEPTPLVLAATSALATGLLPAALRLLESRIGQLPVELRIASPGQLAHDVTTGTVHLAASSLPLEHAGMEVQWIGALPCLAVLPQDDPLAALGIVPLEALTQRRLITMSKRSSLRRRLDALLAGLSRPSGHRETPMETNSSTSALAMARAGLGVAILEPLTVTGMPVDGVAVRPIDIDIPFVFGVVTPQFRPVTGPTRALVDALLEVATALPHFVRHDVSAHAELLQAAHGDEANF